MGIWAIVSMHQMIYPEKLPILVGVRLWIDAPKDLESWEKLATIYPDLRNTIEYKNYIKPPILVENIDNK
jgi:hypothetical protein